VDFDFKVSNSYSDYLINRQTWYIWDLFTFSFFRADVGVGQKLAILPILLALYIVPIFHILEKRSKNLSVSISISVLLFVDDDLLIS